MQGAGSITQLADACELGLGWPVWMARQLPPCDDQIQFLVDTASGDSADTLDQKDLRADLVTQLRAYTQPSTPALQASSASMQAQA